MSGRSWKILMVGLLVVMVAGSAQAKPEFNNSSCNNCHAEFDGNEIDVSGTDPPGLLDPPAWDDGFTGSGGHGPLQAFTVAPGGTVSLTGETLGNAELLSAALNLKRFQKWGDMGSALQSYVDLANSGAGWTVRHDALLGDALYFTQRIGTSRGPFSFDLTILPTTPPGLYDLEFAAAGGIPSGDPPPPFGQPVWHSDEHFYLQVVPEPGALAMLAGCLAALGLWARRRKKAA